jgi:ClpP class serine protease
MFGAGVPVCAVYYSPALPELVVDGFNGRIFHNSDALSKQLIDLLYTTDTAYTSTVDTVSVKLSLGSAELSALQCGVASSISTWEDNWAACVLEPIVKHAVSRRRVMPKARSLALMVLRATVFVLSIVAAMRTS